MNSSVTAKSIAAGLRPATTTAFDVLGGVGLLGNLLAAFVFRRMALNAPPYVYQTGLMLVDAGSLVMVYFASALRHNRLLDWFGVDVRQSYFLSFLYAHPFNSFIQANTASSQYLMVAATFERLKALNDPIAYKIQNHKRRFLLALGTAIVVAEVYFLPNAIFNLEVKEAANGTGWDVSPVLRTNKERYPLLKVYYSSLAVHFVGLYALLIGSTVKLVRGLRAYEAKGHAAVKEAAKTSNPSRLLMAQLCLNLFGLAPRLANELVLLLLPRAWFHDRLDSYPYALTTDSESVCTAQYPPLVPYGNRLPFLLNIFVYAGLNKRFREQLKLLIPVKFASVEQAAEARSDDKPPAP